MKSFGVRIERSTCVSAAKLTIASQPAAARSTVSGSPMSPTTSSAPTTSRFAGLPAYVSLASTATSAPAAASRRTKCEPMKPAPPVTSTFTRRRLVVHDDQPDRDALDRVRGRLGCRLLGRQRLLGVEGDDD